MIVLALLAIIVVGPKDLPVLMRKLGQMMGKIRSMGQEFKDAFADMESETEMSELRKEIEELKKIGKFTDDDLSNEMREIDSVIRDATDFSNPKAAAPESLPDSAPAKPKAAKPKTVKPKVPKPKSNAKAKAARAKAKARKAAPKKS